MEKITRLNLASGKDYRDGYFNIDNGSMLDDDYKIDQIADVKHLDWEENTLNEILLSHFMMYVDTFEADELFKKWYKWLKKDGILIIETGDLKKVCKTILENKDPDIINGTNGVMQLFGWANTKGHTWAWCEETITPLLVNAGFDIVGCADGGFHKRPERDFTIIAKKK